MISFWIDKLNNELNKVLSKSVKNLTRICIPFSGGIDSSLLALIASKYTDITLYVTGIEGAYDLKAAKSSANLLKLPLIEITVMEEDIEASLPLVTKITQSKNPVEISFLLPLFFVAKNSREKIICSAQGADELFAGYARYLRVKDLAKELENDLISLKEVGILKAEKIATYFNKELLMPFLEPSFVELSLKIPAEYKIKEGIRKYILRELGRTLELPAEIVVRKKKAAQYGSGIMKIMKKLASKNKLSLSEYLQKF